MSLLDGQLGKRLIETINGPYLLDQKYASGPMESFFIFLLACEEFFYYYYYYLFSIRVFAKGAQYYVVCSYDTRLARSQSQ